MIDNQIDKRIHIYLGAIDWGRLYSESQGIIDDSCEEYIEICNDFKLNDDEKWSIINYMEKRLSDMYDLTLRDEKMAIHQDKAGYIWLCM